MALRDVGDVPIPESKRNIPKRVLDLYKQAAGENFPKGFKPKKQRINTMKAQLEKLEKAYPSMAFKNPDPNSTDTTTTSRYEDAFGDEGEDREYEEPSGLPEFDDKDFNESGEYLFDFQSNKKVEGPKGQSYIDKDDTPDEDEDDEEDEDEDDEEDDEGEE